MLIVAVGLSAAKLLFPAIVIAVIGGMEVAVRLPNPELC